MKRKHRQRKVPDEGFIDLKVLGVQSTLAAVNDGMVVGSEALLSRPSLDSSLELHRVPHVQFAGALQLERRQGAGSGLPANHTAVSA